MSGIGQQPNSSSSSWQVEQMTSSTLMAEKCGNDTPSRTAENIGDVAPHVVARTLLTFTKSLSDWTSRDEQARECPRPSSLSTDYTAWLAGADRFQSTRARTQCTSDGVVVCRRIVDRTTPTWRLRLARWGRSVATTTSTSCMMPRERGAGTRRRIRTLQSTSLTLGCAAFGLEPWVGWSRTPSYLAQWDQLWSSSAVSSQSYSAATLSTSAGHSSRRHSNDVDSAARRLSTFNFRYGRVWRTSTGGRKRLLQQMVIRETDISDSNWLPSADVVVSDDGVERAAELLGHNRVV